MRTRLWTESFRCFGQKTWLWFSATAASTISTRSFSPDCARNSDIYLISHAGFQPGQGCPLDQSDTMPDLLGWSCACMIVNNPPAFREAFEDQCEPSVGLILCSL